jgi:hypothetical protein
MTNFTCPHSGGVRTFAAIPSQECRHELPVFTRHHLPRHTQAGSSLRSRCTRAAQAALPPRAACVLVRAALRRAVPRGPGPGRLTVAYAQLATPPRSRPARLAPRRCASQAVATPPAVWPVASWPSWSWGKGPVPCCWCTAGASHATHHGPHGGAAGQRRLQAWWPLTPRPMVTPVGAAPPTWCSLPPPLPRWPRTTWGRCTPCWRHSFGAAMALYAQPATGACRRRAHGAGQRV